jgi:hypothetical protein
MLNYDKSLVYINSIFSFAQQIQFMRKKYKNKK